MQDRTLYKKRESLRVDLRIFLFQGLNCCYLSISMSTQQLLLTVLVHSSRFIRPTLSLKLTKTAYLLHQAQRSSCRCLWYVYNIMITLIKNDIECYYQPTLTNQPLQPNNQPTHKTKKQTNNRWTDPLSVCLLISR